MFRNVPYTTPAADANGRETLTVGQFRKLIDSLPAETEIFTTMENGEHYRICATAVPVPDQDSPDYNGYIAVTLFPGSMFRG